MATTGVTDSSFELVGSISSANGALVRVNVFPLQKDSIEAVLHERLSAAMAVQNAYAWSGIAATIWTAYVSAAFREVLGMQPETVEAVFFVGGIATTLTAARWLVKAWRNRNRSSVSSIAEEITRRALPIAK